MPRIVARDGNAADPTSRPLNHLLARLPDPDFARIRPYLRTIPLKHRQVLHHVGEPLREVYFPNGGVASITTLMQNGTQIEVATVGREGFLGAEAVFGADLVTREAMVQIPDTSAEAMAAGDFRRELAANTAFRAAIDRFLLAFLGMVAQSTACLAVHNVQERCCRWLLHAHDRVDCDTFQLSHEFLAMMLGATRPTVSVVAGTLQKAGMIAYTYGHMTILNRSLLEDAACECYATITADADRLRL